MTDDQAFHKLCGSLHFHNAIYDRTSPENFISGGIDQLDADERIQAKRFLGNLLSSQKTDQGLQDIWFASGPDVFIPDGGQFRMFLRMIEQML